MSSRHKGLDPARVRLLREAGLSLREIGAQLGVSKTAVSYWLASDEKRARWNRAAVSKQKKRRAVPRRRQRRSRRLNHVDAQVRALSMYGLYVGARWSLERISERYGVTRERVRQIIEPLSPPGLYNRPHRPRKVDEYAERRQWALALREVAEPQRLRRTFGLPDGTRLSVHGERLWFPVWGWTQQDRIVALWNAGFNYREIAKHLRFDPYLATTRISVVLNRAREYGLEVRRGVTGPRGPRAKREEAG